MIYEDPFPCMLNNLCNDVTGFSSNKEENTAKKVVMRLGKLIFHQHTNGIVTSDKCNDS